MQLDAQQVKLRMASPITVYASLPDGKTHYYNPLDPEFSHGVNDNYHAKWRSATGTEAPGSTAPPSPTAVPGRWKPGRCG